MSLSTAQGNSEKIKSAFLPILSLKLSKLTSGISAILVSVIVSILLIYNLELNIPVENLVFDTGYGYTERILINITMR